MATGEQWIEHFKKVSDAKKKKIKAALKVLESDSMIKKEYGWTRIFSLPALMRE